jgi:hypothetical protein
MNFLGVGMVVRVTRGWEKVFEAAKFCVKPIIE